MTDQLNINDMPLGGLRPTDILFKEMHDGTCSRCQEQIAEAEVPLLLWPEEDRGHTMYVFCNRCAWDPDSARCRKCGCTENQPCEDEEFGTCGWVAPDLCTCCARGRQLIATIAENSSRAEEWRHVFGGLEVPLKNQPPVISDGPYGIDLFYQADVERITPEQLDRAVDFLAKKFGLPADEVRDGVLHSEGIPIAARDITITTRPA